MKISIIGSGWVGLGIGKSFLRMGHNVVFFDINKETTEKLKKEGFKAYNSGLDEVVKNSDVSFIAVPTPFKDGRIDLSFIESVSKDCGEAVKSKNEYHVFVVKSTIIPGTMEDVVIPLLEKWSGKKCGADFGALHNPEFLTAISGTWNTDKSFERKLESEDRIVIGEGNDKKSGNVLESLYKNFEIPIIRTNYKTAEIIKYASNMSLASKISINNEFFALCEKIGVDGQFVANVVSMDNRIGKYGSVCGKAFGGTCFPKDLKSIISFADSVEYDAHLLKSIDKLNESLKENNGVRE